MSSEDNPGKMVSSSETRLSVDAKEHDDILENVGDDDGVRLVSEEDDSDNLKVDEGANPLSNNANNAAQMLPLLNDLLLNNEIQRERLIGLLKLYDPTPAEDRNATVNTEGEQITRETDLSSEVHLLKQSVKKLEEEIENQKKANAQLEDQIKRLTESQ